MRNVQATQQEEALEERARIEGVETLGDTELMALVLGTGATSQRLAEALLREQGGLLGLAREGLRGARVEGLNEARRLRLEAALELGRRSSQRASLPVSLVMNCPERVAAWGWKRLGHLTHEELWMLALNGRQGLLAARRLSQGGAHGCALGIQDVLRVALRVGASSFVLLHNHPSGDPMPSEEDARMSREVARAAGLVGLRLLDHVVVGADRHASLFELGLLAG